MTTLTKIVAASLIAAMPLAPLAAQEAPSTAAQAEPKVRLQSDVKAFKQVTDASGNETNELVEPTIFTPGTRLSFGLSYDNQGQLPATNVTATNPLSEAVRLAPDADPALIVSVDGGESFGTLASLSITTETGATRPATHADVTHVRWTIASIAPGESGRVAFPVIIR
ncbi:MAG: hypothetical protein AAF494_04120 [Pseudomonadota bacterium]